MSKVFLQKNILLFLFTLLSYFSYATTFADTLLPGNISTCGELAAPGTYTLTQNLSGGTNTCLTISSDNVIINGGGYTISGTGDTAIDARARTGGSAGPLTDGAHAYTNLVINDLNISGYTTGLNISGNDDLSGTGVNSGYAGDAGDVAIYYSYIGSITANGGQATSKSYGGVGGNIAFNDTNLNIASSTISTLGGVGNTGSNTRGGLTVNYTTGISVNNLALSSLSYLSVNGNNYNNFSGGTWPIFPGNISSCGTLFGSGTFTLTQDLTSSSNCFNISSNNITINGAGHSITLLDASSTSFAIESGSYSGLILASTTVSNFSNLIHSSSSVTISGHNLDLSGKKIEAGSLTVNYTGSINTLETILSPLSSLTINGTVYNNFSGGTWPIFPGNISSCGTLFGAGTYTLTQDVMSSSTCFNISSDDVIIDGAGHSIISNIENSEYYAITVGIHTGFTLASTTVKVFSKLINSSSTVTILGHDLDLSNKYINVSGLIISVTGFINRIGLTSGVLSSLIVNGYSYNLLSGSILGILRLENSYDYNWSGITVSSNGKKIAAAAYSNTVFVSDDYGTTWVSRGSNRSWRDIDSSADGTRLIAADQGGYIYVSSDSGLTWTPQTSMGSKSWWNVASSADGKKLMAAVMWGGVYTSDDYGATWTLRSYLGNKRWYAMDVTPSGNKMIAVDFDGLVYVSSNAGISWTSYDPGTTGLWSLSTSADGSKLFAVKQGGNLYMSNDGGLNWTTANIPGGTKNWYAVSASYDGSVIYAAPGGEYIYKSVDSGTTWESIPGSSKYWSAIDTSADGGLLYAQVTNEKIRQYQGQSATNYISSFSPINGSVLTSWTPFIYWGSSAQCKYSYDNWITTNNVNCDNYGNDIPNPGYGTYTLYIRGYDSEGVLTEASSTFTFGLAITVTNPAYGSTTTSWSPSVDWDPGNTGNITTCLYSYDNWVSTSTVNCNNDGNDILPPGNNGTTTLSLKVYDSNNQYGFSDVTFVYNVSSWYSRDSVRNWFSITSSSDGTKLAATAYGGYIYTSNDSGLTWTAQTTSGNRNWYGLASSNDGTKLAAVVKSGQIYTSTTSGATWVARDSNRTWDYITSSSDGVNLAATVNGGNIYTSTTSGATWVAQTSAGSRAWHQITSSADGTRLAAVVQNGYIYTSSNSGITWSTTTVSLGTKNWWGITMTADGQHLAAVQAGGGNIYTSDDYGVNWNARQSIAAAYAITYSADGSKLIAAVGGSSGTGPIYVSNDYGVTWTTQEANRKWYSIASSADGTKLAAVHYGGKIYTSTNGLASVISIIRPSSDTSILAKVWSAMVNWGSSVSCYYSYNSWVSSSTVNCANSGSDILKPITDGLTTLYVRGVDALSNQYNQAVTFDFEPWTARDLGRNWLNIDMSSDGQKMIAAAQYNWVYMSTTTGVTWGSTLSSKDWRDVSSSLDGTKLIAVSATPASAGSGLIMYSTTSGATWSTSTIPAARDWTTVDSSDTGQYAIAGAFANYIHVSSDYGATWTAKTGPGTPQWYASAISADGSTMAAAAAVGGSRIWFSKDFGSTWTATGTAAAYYSIAISADGNLIVAVPASNGQPHFGTYANGSWTWTSKGPTGSWWGVDVSPDGTKIVITSASSGYIYLSEDGGNTWTQKGAARNWRGVKFVGNTKKFTAVVNGGQIYNSFSTPYIISPTSSSTLMSWTPSVSWDRSVTCQYSFDNSTWSNASCSGNGSDISSPSTSGSKTLHIKATDFEGYISTSSVSFDYIATISNSNSINSCGRISSPGTYVLTQDISDVSGICFVVNADDVIIDGAGYTISAAAGNNNYAITAGASQNLKIQNLHFTGFNLGVASSTSSVEYAGSDVDISNSTTTASILKLTYTNTLTAVNTYLSSLSSIIINGVDLWSFATAGIFTWNQQDISSCVTISSPGYYRLTQDISNISGTCFDIQSKYVVLDGDNHTLTAANGNGNFAFLARNTFNTNNKTGGVAIKNITLNGFGGGIDARSANVDLDYINQFPSADAVSGTNVSLYNVNFPTNTVSVNTSGGNGFWNGSISRGGSAGGLKVSNSTLGTIVLNGGNSPVVQNLGSNIGTISGGTLGSVTRVNSNIYAINAASGASAIPGCMDNNYLNYNSNATYNDGSCSQGAIGVDSDNPVGNIISTSTIDFYLKSNYGIVDGNAVYYGHNVNSTSYGSSTNYGTTTGHADFYGSGYGGGNAGYIGNGGAYFETTDNFSTGIVDGSTSFYYGYNYGLINGNTNFNGYGGGNYGTINGQVLYGGYSGNNYGTINGTADFTNYFSANGNYNYGIVNGDAIFYYTYENQGTVTGTVAYYYGCLDPSASNYESNAIVHNDGYCDYVGSQQDNYNFVRGPVTFTNGYSNYGTVRGDAIFESGSYNYGYVYGTTTFNSTINYGYVYGDAIFNNNQGSGYVSGDAYLNNINTYGTGKLIIDGITISDSYWISAIQGDMYDVNNIIINTIEFTNSMVNYGVLHINAIFNDSTYNYGQLYGNVLFKGSSVNNGDISSNSVIFEGNSVNQSNLIESPNTVVFNDNAVSISGQINADVKLNTYGYSRITNTLPTDSTLKIESYGWNTIINGNVYDSNNSIINRYEFYNTTENNSGVVGNAVFNDTSHNNASISGDATFNTYYYGPTPTSTVMYIFNSNLNGNIGGDILSSDEVTKITDFVFRNGSNNNITINGNAVFYDSSSNNTVINGNAVFNNTSPFTMGTVNGSVVLNGLAQTINGINNIQNLTKNSNVRDVLFLSSGSTLNISGLLVLTGLNQNNLLTIKSTTPDTYVNLNINGSSTLNYLRMKDIRNNSSLIDLTNAIVFDDGGNQGFVFTVNSTPGTRGGITGVFTAPSLPVSRGGAAPITPPAPTNNNNRNNPNASPVAVTLDKFINPNIKPLEFKPTQNFNILDNTNIGTTFIPNPLSGIKALTVIDFIKLPVNFLNNVRNFALNALLKDNKNYSNSLITYLYNKGFNINNEQDLAKLKVRPVHISDKDNIYDSVFRLNNSYISYDHSVKSLVQKIKIPINTYIVLRSDNVKSIKYFNKNFNLIDSKINVLSPDKPGSYMISSTNIPLVLDVYEPIDNSNGKKMTVIQKLVKWTKSIFK